MKVLGLDPSTVATGYGILVDGQYTCSGVRLFTKGTKHRRAMLREFGTFIDTLIRMHTPDIVIIEDVRGKNAGRTSISTIMPLAQLQGIILTQTDCLLLAVHTSSWKAHVLLNGKSGKLTSIPYVKEKFHLTHDVTDDEADALCIAYSYWCVGTKFTKIA